MKQIKPEEFLGYVEDFRQGVQNKLQKRYVGYDVEVVLREGLQVVNPDCNIAAAYAVFAEVHNVGQDVYQVELTQDLHTIMTRILLR
jgi:hypothetical protein